MNAVTADVHVVPGPSGTVSVQQDVAARGLTRGFAEQAVLALVAGVSATSAGDEVVVSADTRPCCLPSIVVAQTTDDLTVSLPEGASLRVTTASGDIEVRALAGPVDITTGSGGVTLDGATVSHALRVRTRSGVSLEKP